MDSDIAQKQGYLYSQVIEGGYNPEEFQDFLCTSHPQWGTDLANWPMAELKKITEEFIKINSSKTIQQPEPQKQTESPEKIEQSSPYKPAPGTLAYGEKHEHFSKTVACIKTPESKFYKSPIKVFIEKFEKREGSVFEKSYFIFVIKTQDGNYKVERRYSDFEWMRQTLMIVHPWIPVPPISKKGGMKKRSDEKHLVKRLYLLQKFLNKMMSIPELRSDDIFEKFMTLPSQKQFQKYKLKYKKIKHVDVQKIQTLSGTIDLVLSQETNTFITRAQKYFTISQPEVKKIYKDFKGAATMLENCSAFLKNIGENCFKLSNNYRQFRKEANLSLTQQNLFSVLDQMTSKYSQLLTEQAKTFRKQIYALVKYESLYLINMGESLDKLAHLQQSFIEEKAALAKKKQKLFEEGNMTKWGLTQKLTERPPREQAFQLMLPKQTKQVMKDREQYALCSSMIYNESLRHFKQNDLYLYDYFDEIAKMETDISSRGVMLWADVQMKTKGLTIQTS